ncbi:MAG: hypothetical protein L3J43_11655, partial [Sulfurovum sp.]|nr:hypothetical protein [Sulfurovum sp.]
MKILQKGVLIASLMSVGSAVYAESPGGVSGNLSLWLKADKGIQTLNSNEVGDWIDQTGTNDFTVTGTPQIISNALNFNNMVNFDGNDYLTGNFAIPFKNAYVVYQFNSITQSGALMSPTLPNDSNDGYFMSGSGLFTGDNGADDTVNYLETSASMGADPHLMNLDVINGQTQQYSKAYQDAAPLNVSKMSTNVIGEMAVHTSIPYIGRASHDLYPAILNAKVAEVIMYSASHTLTQRKQIQSYLALKYGITLDQTSPNDYLASDGATKVWDAATAGAYKHDIFGLGKDPSSGLNQQISKSVNSDAIVTLSTDTDLTSANGTHASLADGSAEVISNDNGALDAWSKTNAPAGFVTIARKWKVQETGTVGTVNLMVDVDDADANIPDFQGKLYISINGGTPVAMTETTEGKWTTSYDFATGDTFTFVVENSVDVEFSNAIASSTDESNSDNFPKLSLNGVVNIETSVQVTQTGGTATVTNDYTYSSQTVTIPVGVYDGTLTTALALTAPTLVDDGVVEGDETIEFDLATPKEGVKITGVSTHTYTITDDDTLPPVTDSNVTVPTTPTNNAN